VSRRLQTRPSHQIHVKTRKSQNKRRKKHHTPARGPTNRNNRSTVCAGTNSSPSPTLQVLRTVSSISRPTATPQNPPKTSAFLQKLTRVNPRRRKPLQKPQTYLHQHVKTTITSIRDPACLIELWN
jgi:hypothetical protein